MSLGMRISLTFGILVLALLGVVTAGVLRLDTLSVRSAEAVLDRQSKAKLVQGIVEEFGALSAAVHGTLLVESRDALAREVERIDAARQTIGQMLQTLDTMMAEDDAASRALLQVVHDRNAAYLVGLTRFTRLLAAQKTPEARVLLGGELKPQLDGAYRAMQELSRHQYGRIEEVQSQSADSYRRARDLTLLLALAAVGVAIALGLWLARRITAPLGEAVHVAGQVAAGDLTSRVGSRGGDETGQLMAALAKMNESLTRIVHDVRTASEGIANAATELVSGNSNLLQRTEEQASALEESASSMEELTATVKANAASAREANQLARDTSAVAGRGGEIIGRVVSTMQGIHAGAKRVEDITGVIDGIAFQTNILALNAAVEAARAGEQGRGFAVVATEVRALAQRCATAAKEIKGVIAASAAQVDEGAKLVGAAGTTMDDILKRIRDLDALVARIAAASQEQSSGIDQVSAALVQMEKMTQQNAALAEESAAAVESLEGQARTLLEAVQVFKLTASAAPLPAPASALGDLHPVVHHAAGAAAH